MTQKEVGDCAQKGHVQYASAAEPARSNLQNERGLTKFKNRLLGRASSCPSLVLRSVFFTFLNEARKRLKQSLATTITDRKLTGLDIRM